MFGFGNKKNTYQITSSSPDSKDVMIIAKSEKEALKNIPEDYREDVRSGKSRLERVS